jgi:hypothetical protein
MTNQELDALVNYEKELCDQYLALKGSTQEKLHECGVPNQQVQAEIYNVLYTDACPVATKN